jgi:hypothetical protein
MFSVEEDGNNRLLRKVSTNLPDYTASRPAIPYIMLRFSVVHFTSRLFPIGVRAERVYVFFASHCMLHDRGLDLNTIMCNFWRNSPTRARAALFSSFLDRTQLHTTVSRTPLDEGSARGRDLFMTTHNTHKRLTSMIPAEFEPAIPASELPYTLALDRSVTGIGIIVCSGG